MLGGNSTTSVFSLGPSTGSVSVASGSVWPVAVGVSVTLHAGMFIASLFLPFGFVNSDAPIIELQEGEQAIRVRIASGCEPQLSASPRSTLAIELGSSLTEEYVVAETHVLEIDPTPYPDVAEDHQSWLERILPAPQRVGLRSEGTFDLPARPSLVKTDLISAIVQNNPAEVPNPDPTESAAIEIPRENVTGVDSPKPVPEEDPAQVALETPAIDATQGVESGVEILELSAPDYPSLSRRRGEEGRVVLQVEVKPDGVAGEISVFADPGYPRLVNAAINAARQAKYKPAIRDGRTITDSIQIPFRFVLK